MRNKVFLSMATRRSLVSRQEGQTFFKCLSDLAPELLPERYGNWEPLRKQFNRADTEAALAAWQYPLLWTTRKPRVRGSVWHGISPPPSQGDVVISVDEGAIPLGSLVNLVCSMAQDFLADFALIHLLTSPEKQRGSEQDAVFFTDRAGTKGGSLSVPPIMLRTKYVPDLYWFTIFGPPYVKLFGRDRLLSAPAKLVQELPYGGILLQLTSSISDLTDRPEEFEAARSAVMAHLDHDVFFDPAKGPDYPYQRPNFLDREPLPEISESPDG